MNEKIVLILKVIAIIVVIASLISITILTIYPINNKNNIITNKPELNPIVGITTPSYNAKIWSTIISPERSKIIFPELCPSSMYGSPIPNINKVSIAISGGGSRSFVCTMGYFRALNRMGYKNKAQYVSSVSGGSWFYGLYSCCQSNPKFTDSLLLGSSNGLNSNGLPNPSLITLENLKSNNKRNSLYFGYIFENKDLIEYIIQALVFPSIKIDQAWNYAIGKLILEPYNLNSDGPLALNAEHAKDLLSRNIFNGAPIILPPGIPFWICNTTLMLNYVNQYPYITVPMTPLYSGIPQLIVQNNNKIGGNLVETFAFGNSKPPLTDINFTLASDNCLNSYNAKLQRISVPRTLKDLIGTSSTVYASVLYDQRSISSILDTLLPDSSIELIPSYNIWGSSQLSLTTSDSQCTSDLINGGCKVPNGYDSKSCSRINAKCYSNTATQCNSNSQCSWQFSKGECANTNSNNSDLNCRSNASFFNPIGCKCITGTSYIQTNTQNLYNQSAKLSDGGFSDNTGVISLLSREVKHIISFQNGTSLSDFSDNCDLKALFGLAKTNCYVEGQLSMNTIQVFKTTDFNNIFSQFQKTFNSGGPTFARANLEVLPNLNNGIVGKYTVDILFVILLPSSKFVNSLPLEVKNQITNTSSLSRGDFNNFPNYATFFPNLNMGGISLTLSQTNLLSTYTDWCLNQPELKTHIDQLFGY